MGKIQVYELTRPGSPEIFEVESIGVGEGTIWLNGKNSIGIIPGSERTSRFASMFMGIRGTYPDPKGIVHIYRYNERIDFKDSEDLSALLRGERSNFEEARKIARMMVKGIAKVFLSRYNIGGSRDVITFSSEIPNPELYRGAGVIPVEIYRGRSSQNKKEDSKYTNKLLKKK